MQILLRLFFSIALSCACASSARVSEKIYQSIDGGFSCFRRLNGTNQFGCSSSRSGNVGVVHLISGEQEDADWLIDKGPHAPYVVLLWPKDFHAQLLTRLEDSGKVSGVVVLNSTEYPLPSSYSPDQHCPNQRSGLYDIIRSPDLYGYCETKPWNPPGQSMLFKDWKFPIFFLDETETLRRENRSVLIDECYLKFNKPINGEARDWPLCSAQLKSPMYAAVDSPTCIRRGILDSYINPQMSLFCDPLGNQNIYLPLLPSNKSEGEFKNQSVVFVVARMDSFTMFDEIAPGADSAITGVATLLATAQLLSHYLNDLNSTLNDVANVFFVLFHGEAFDYIGSSRMVYDMQRNMFPKALNTENPSQMPLIKPQHIRAIIELGQLGSKASEGAVYIHTDPLSQKDPTVAEKIKQLVDVVTSNTNAPTRNVTLKTASYDIPLPPASMQSFLKSDLSIPGIVLSNHEESFVNPFYNSELDNKHNVGFNTSTSKQDLSAHLGKIATLVASSVFQIATGKQLPSEAVANQTLVESFLYCTLESANCSLFRSVINGPFYPGRRPTISTYVGVSHSPSSTEPETAFTLLIRNILISVTGKIVPFNKTACSGPQANEIYHYFWLGESSQEEKNGACFLSNVKLSPAVSPAFIIDDYDWNSGTYSSWTESRWEASSLRIFLQPSKSRETVTFCTGAIVLILAFVITYWASSNSGALFSDKSTESNST